MMVPRGKMLGGSSGINYMAYVRGHPGDFDAWADGGASGWSLRRGAALLQEVRGPPAQRRHRRRPRRAQPGRPARRLGPLARDPRRAAVRRRRGRGRHPDRRLQRRATGTGRRAWRRCSRPPPRTASAPRPSTPSSSRSWASATTSSSSRTPRCAAILLEDGGGRAGRHRRRVPHPRRRCRDGDGHPRGRALGRRHRLTAAAAAVRDRAGGRARRGRRRLPARPPRRRQAPQGPPAHAHGLPGARHRPDHDRGRALARPGRPARPGRSAARRPRDDVDLPPELAGVKAEAERRLGEWVTTGRSLVSSSLYDAGLWYSTGLGDEHTHDAQIGFLVCGYTPDLWQALFRIDPQEYFSDPAAALAPDAEVVVMLPNPVQPHSEGEVRLASADPLEPPVISLNYFSDPHDVDGHGRRHAPRAGAGGASGRCPAWGRCTCRRSWRRRTATPPGDVPSDELLEDLARHYALTVYHETSTCRMGDVVDTDLRVQGRAAAARRRRQRHAERDVGEHQRPDDHDRREGRRAHRGRARHRAGRDGRRGLGGPPPLVGQLRTGWPAGAERSGPPALVRPLRAQDSGCEDRRSP